MSVSCVFGTGLLLRISSNAVQNEGLRSCFRSCNEEASSQDMDNVECCTIDWATHLQLLEELCQKLRQARACSAVKVVFTVRVSACSAVNLLSF